jgi:hypothetical protein
MNCVMTMVVIIIIIIIIIITITCFYELQDTYCYTKLSTLLAILIHNMVHECFSKFITPNFTGINRFESQKEITAQLLTSSAVRDTIYTQHTCWFKENATVLCVQNFH